MSKSLKVMFCLLFLSGVTGMVSPVVFSQEEIADVVLNEVNGKINSVDIDNSALVIGQPVPGQEGAYKDITILVDESTYIEKNSAAVSLSDLKAEDKVAVKYVVNEEGENIATHILIKE